MLNWTNRFNTFSFLDSNGYELHPNSYDCIIGAGIRRKLSANSSTAFDELSHFTQNNNTWLFGHLGYDLKNGIEKLDSSHPDLTGFPDMFLFEPEIVVRMNHSAIIIDADNPENVFDEIMKAEPTPSQTHEIPGGINARLTRENYIDTINRLKEHIHRGDCYEINFCQEFYAEESRIDPYTVYRKLSSLSPNPFAALYRSGDSWLICASPERFLRKEGKKLVSQPIKGTSRRVMDDVSKDEASRNTLYNSPKERSENVMIVDLVRNDLSRICERGSVKVGELFGIYSFPQVHQMISTITGNVKEDASFADIIKATFPMGSMTGAPKKRVMELIEKYEQSRRGIFSGAVGYITPGGDFDFNVVIRSIMYNAGTGYLSFLAGSGITWYSNAEAEWDECLAKTEAIRKVLGI